MAVNDFIDQRDNRTIKAVNDENRRLQGPSFLPKYEDAPDGSYLVRDMIAKQLRQEDRILYFVKIEDAADVVANVGYEIIDHSRLPEEISKEDRDTYGYDTKRQKPVKYMFEADYIALLGAHSQTDLGLQKPKVKTSGAVNLGKEPAPVKGKRNAASKPKSAASAKSRKSNTAADSPAVTNPDFRLAASQSED